VDTAAHSVNTPTVKLNQSVQKAIAILRAASSSASGETASTLARRTGLPWATAARLIRTLEEEGFLYRIAESDRYVIGFDLIGLGREVDRGRQLVETAQPMLERLAGEVNETINLTVVHPDGRLEVVKQIDAPRFIGPTSYVGLPYPLHASSIGKLLLSTFDEARLEKFLADGLQTYTSATITDADDLREELARIRRRGWSSAVDELEDGLSALSVGVRHADHELVAIVTVSGPSFRFDEPARMSALEPLRDAAAAVELRIGGSANVRRQAIDLRKKTRA
jgi:DNA-binding IclR family transcriptional regulator